MMRALAALPLLGSLALAACGSDPPPPLPPPPPTVLNLSLQASPDMNPDAAGQPKPLRVRVLRLAAVDSLAQADFHALDADPSAALGKALVGQEEVVLVPGATVPLTAEFEADARFVAVVAAYYAVDRAQWRAWQPVPKQATTSLTATLGAAGLDLAAAKGATP